MDDTTRDDYQSEVRRLRAELSAIEGGGEGDGDSRPRPLRQSEIIRALLAGRHAVSSGKSSVELWTTAGGDVNRRVTVYAGDEPGVETVEQAAAKAAEVFDALGIVYPGKSPKAQS